jgi:hypothetical protein
MRAMILNDLTLRLAQKALVGADACIFDLLNRDFHIPAEWTALQRSVMSACRRRRNRKIAKWLGVTIARRRDLSVPGSLLSNRSAIEDIYGYSFDKVSVNPFLIAATRAMNGDTFQRLLHYFWRARASSGWVGMWVETRDNVGNRLIEKWRCSYNGQWFKVLSTLRLVICKHHGSCGSKEGVLLPWLKGGDYFIRGWPALRVPPSLGR